MIPRLKLGVLAVAIAVSLGAMTPALARPSATYLLKRDGFRITLVFERSHLVHLRVAAREHCNDGRSRTPRVREYGEDDLERVPARGRLLYEGGSSTEYGYTETRLSLHVTPHAIRGGFYDLDTEVGYYLCATGHAGARVLKFTAPRSGG